MEKKKLEILAPAGSFESLKAAVHAGADAVYMGGGRFGARAYADNPEGDLLLEAIDYAHLYGVKLYLTVNTLLKETELREELYDYLKPCYEHGLDAVIVQDLGVMKSMQGWFPDLPIHASTQMTLCGAGGAKFLKEAGAERIVLARELSLKEIEKIHREVDVEIECFVHGALCYCYSGQCLFSSILGGRSGNRGRCAQPCRLAYEAAADGRIISKKGENALLSPKDICAVDLIPQIAEAGVYSLKIEGRMKRPEYTAGVVRIYRKYVDQYLEHGAKGYQVADEDRKELLLLFNRDGFSRGYYEQHNGRNMMALKNLPPSDKEKREYETLIASLKKEYVDTEKKRSISGCLYAKAGEPMRLDIRTAESGLSGHTDLCAEKESEPYHITVFGECPQLPQNRPMEEAQLRKQMEKTGNTPFVWENLRIQAEGPLFVPNQALNSLRREAMEKMQAVIVGAYYRRSCDDMKQEDAQKMSGSDRFSERKKQEASERSGNPELHISVETVVQLETVLAGTGCLKAHRAAKPGAIYLDAESLEEQLMELIARVHKHDLKAYVALPAVFRRKTAERYERNKDFWASLPADGYVIKNLEEYEFLRQIHWLERPWITDHNLYTFNQSTRQLWREKGSFMQTNPLELNSRELKTVTSWDSIQVVYGRYPMMTTAGCIHKTLNQCRKESEQWTLRDRYQKAFPVKNYCRDCYNVIFNSQPLYLLDQMETVRSLGAGAYRIMFTTEDAAEVRQILNNWMDGSRLKTDFTRGHFKRGVE